MRPRTDLRRRQDPADDGSDFVDTRPLRDHQERLHAQWGYPRAHYKPNHVPAAQRVMLALLSTTWIAWALIGLLSGHLFIWALAVLLHMTGPAAWLLSLAVLVSAAACSVSLVDHIDKRDNEHRYRQARRQLWRAAGALALASLLIHGATTFDLLPPMAADLGLVSPARLQAALQQPALQHWMAQHHDGIHTWWWVTGLWALMGGIVFHKLGLLTNDASDARAGGTTLIYFMSFVVPALATFSLYLADSLVMGHVAEHADSAHELQVNTVWTLTLLVTTLGSLGFVLVATVIGFLRQLRPEPLRRIDPRR
jgi:hypothetical protein